MIKQTYRWFLLAGSLMVLLAVAMLTQIGHTSGQQSAYQRLRLAQAVDNLQPCLTCHSAVAQQPAMLVNNAPSHAVTLEETQASQPIDVLAFNTSTRQSSSEMTDLTAEVDVRLVDLGTRLLHTPNNGDARYTSIVEDFLRIHQETRNHPDRAHLVNALYTIDGIEQLVITFENEAQPIRWNTASHTTPITCGAATAMHSAPAPNIQVAAHSRSIALPILFAYTSRCSDIQIVTPARVVVVVHRRGPPAGMAVESVFV